MKVTKQEGNGSEPSDIKKAAKKGKVAKKTHSNFFITINSQKRMNTLAEPEYSNVKKHFDEIIDKFFNEAIQNFIIYEHSKSAEPFLEKTDDVEELKKRIILDECKIEYVLEIGPETSCLHSHGILALSKRGVNTKLDYKKIKEWLDDKLGYISHFNCRVYTDSKANLKEYMGKTVTK